MSEAERAAALKSIQLELFQLDRDSDRARRRFKATKRQIAKRRRELKQQFVLMQGGGKKRCRKCREQMDLEQFYRDSRYSDQHDPYCIECRLKMAKQRITGRHLAA